jgi:DegV family protein with EDD domain
MDFVISCESTIDMPYKYCQERQLEVVFSSFIMNDIIYQDNMYRDTSFDNNFYHKLAIWHSLPKSSEIPFYTYLDHFRRILSEGKEIIHICVCARGSKSFYHALAAANTVQNEFPTQRIAIIDSTCVSFAYGMLIDDVCDLRDEGKSFFEIEDYIESNKFNYHAEFFVKSVKYLVHTKKMKKTLGNLVSLFHLKLLVRVNEEGRAVRIDNKQTVDQCINYLVDDMLRNCGKDFDDKVVIGYGNDPEIAQRLFIKVKATFPNIKHMIKIRRLGNTTACVTGPNIIALVYKGKRRREK